MAKNAFNLTAQINLQGPSNLRTIVADIRRQVGTINVDINPNINPSAYRSITGLNRVFRDLNTTLAITETNARTTAAALQNLAQAVNNIGGRNLQQNINNAANAAQNLSRQANNAAQGVGAAATGMEQFGMQSALAVRRFAAFTTVTSVIFGLTTAIRSGVSAFIDFDKEFVRLKQVSDSGSAALGLLAKTITDLSVNLGVSSKELTTVSVTLAQAGLSIRDTEKALQALAKSALAPSFDNLNDTVEGSIALMRQFSISSDQLESALGSVNAVAAAFAVEASDLIAAIQRTGGVFATASKGVSEGTDALNEFLAIFTSVRQTTRESAETIATGLRTIFTRIQRGGTIEALKEYGIVLTDLEDKFVGPFEAVKRLSEGLSRLDPRDIRFSSIIEELGGFRQIGKVIPLIQQFAVAQQALKVAQKGSDSLAKDSATAQLSLANQIAKVREEFLALIRSIGQSESFRSFVSLALDLTSGLIKLADAAKIVLPALTALGAIRGLSALTQFGAGFAGSFAAAGGARGLGQRLGGGRRFASGGLVPGSGNQDSVDAKLTPGEFVLRKSAVQDIGVSNLRKINGGMIEKLAMGGLPKGRGLLGRRGARSRFKELTQEEISQLSTQDMIKYGKRLARDVFTTGGAGIATRSQFVEVPSSRVTPELAPYLQTYLGKSGFWQEKVSPFGRTSSRGGLQKIKQKQSRESALAAQKSRLTDEVAARAQEWTSIRQGSPIDNYLLGSLKEPSLSDYKTVRGGGSLSKIFHNTRLRQSVNKALDSFDDFDYSSGNIDRFVSAFAAKKFASGGLVQKFANGETVLQKRERRIQRGYGAGGSGPLQFGLVGLRSGINDVESLPTYLQEPLVTPKKRSVQLNLGTLSNVYKKDFSEQIESSLKGSFTNAVLNLSGSLAKKIGAVSSPSKDRVDRVLEGSGFTAVVGSGLEAALALIGAPYIDKTEATKSLDFPYGLGKAAQLFGTGFPSRVPTDVTRTIGGFGKGKTSILNQIDRFIDATEGGEFTKAFQSKISRKSAAGLSPTLGGILGTLGTRSIKDIAAPGIANQLLQKYGIRARGGLGKSSLEKTLRELPQGQQSGFLSDLDKVVNTGKFASGGAIDTAMALLTPGEAVIDPSMAKSIGYSKLKKMNYADKYAGGGGVGIVPGSGNGDTFGPVPLPVGSFVLRKKATKALGLNRGGVVQKFAEGGNVETGAGFSFSSLFSNFGVLTGAVLGLSAGILALRNNFATVSNTVQGFGRSVGLARNNIGFPRTGTGTARPGGARAGARNFANQGSAIPAGGGFGGIGSFIALTAGGAAISGLGSLVDEKSKTGGVQNKALLTNALGDALNYGAIGATIGSAFLPGFGTAIGAVIGGAAGLATGFISAAKATEEYEKAQMEAAAETVRNDQLKRAQENLAKEADKLNAALAKLLEVSINLSDKYNKASSYLDRFGVELQEVSRANAGLLSDLSGQGRISETSRLDEQVLKNISAYSTAEIAAVANKVGSLAGGGAEGKGLSDTIRAQKIIQEQLPTILRTTQSKDVSGVLNELKQLFKLELGPQLSGPVTSVLNEIDDALGETILKRTGEGSNLNQIADDIQKLVGPVAESAQKVASNLLNQYNNALNEAIRLQNEWIATTERANEINRKASTLRLEADLDLRRTLGQQISPAQENAPFEQNVRGLTASLIRGGTTDPALIGQRIDALRQENVQREKRVEKLQAGPQSNATARAIEAEQEAMRKNKVAINEGTKAIELLADNSAAAANALNRIQVKQQQAKSFVELVKNLYSASPEERLQTNRQLSAFQSGRAALATGRGREFFSNQQAGKDFFAGFEVLKDILGPQLAAQIEKAAVNALVQAGGIPLNTQFPSGVTAGETVALGTTGELRPDDPDKLAYDEAIERQRAALLEFERLMRESADLLQKQVKTIFGNLQDIFNALNRASADLKANIEALTAVRRNKGGLVYASGGALVDSVFKPRGKDTVPAMTTSGQPYMLEPGEMVINRRATNENYDLLKAINGGDNVDGMYATDGGIIGETRQKRREAYEQRKEEARARFRESKPGLARVLDARRKREEKESPELKKARDATYQRREKRKAFGAPGSLTQLEYERDRGQKLFGEFFGSTGDYKDKYYKELESEPIFQDLRATAERPLGYSSLSLEDQNLADIAIDNFISNYESGRTKVIDDKREKLRQQREAETAKFRELKTNESLEAWRRGLNRLDAWDLGLEIERNEDPENQKTPGSDGFGSYIPIGGKVWVGPGTNDLAPAPYRVTEQSLANIRELTDKERDQLRTLKVGQDAFKRESNTKYAFVSRYSEINKDKAEMEYYSQQDANAQKEINPYTGKPFYGAAEKAGVEARAKYDGKTFEEIIAKRERIDKLVGDISSRAKDKAALESDIKEDHRLRLKYGDKHTAPMWDVELLDYYNTYAESSGPDPLTGVDPRMANMLDQPDEAYKSSKDSFFADLQQQENRRSQSLETTSSTTGRTTRRDFGTGMIVEDNLSPYNKDVGDLDPLKAFGIGAAKGVGPTAAGLTAGSYTTAATAPVLGPFAPVAGLLAGVGAAALTSLSQENYLNALAPETNAALNRIAAENPTASALGGAVPGVGAGAVQGGIRSFVGSLTQRAASGAVGAGIGAGIEYGATGQVDPTNVGINFGVGFAQPNLPRQVAQSLPTVPQRVGANGPAAPRQPVKPTAPKPSQVRSQTAARQKYEQAQQAYEESKTDRKIAEFLDEVDAEAGLPNPSIRDLATPQRVRRVDLEAARTAQLRAEQASRFEKMGLEVPEFSTVPDIPTTPRPTRAQAQGPTDFSGKPGAQQASAPKPTTSRTPPRSSTAPSAEDAAKEAAEKAREARLAAKYGETSNRIDITQNNGPTPLANTPSATPVASSGLFPTFMGPLASGAKGASSMLKFLGQIGATRISGATSIAAMGVAASGSASYFGKPLLEAERKRNKPQGFNAGGVVRGKPGIDTNLAALTDGEFVINDKDTKNNLEVLRYINNGGIVKPKKMYDGGDVGGVSRPTSSTSSSNNAFNGYSISLEDKSMTFMQTFSDQLNTFGKDFNSYVTQLSQIKIPDKIEMVGRHSVEVNVNGAAAFEAIEEGVKSLINTEIGKKMNMLWNQSGGQLGESIPTGDFNTGASRTQV